MSKTRSSDNQSYLLPESTFGLKTEDLLPAPEESSPEAPLTVPDFPTPSLVEAEVPSPLPVTAPPGLELPSIPGPSHPSASPALNMPGISTSPVGPAVEPPQFRPPAGFNPIMPSYSPAAVQPLTPSNFTPPASLNPMTSAINFNRDSPPLDHTEIPEDYPIDPRLRFSPPSLSPPPWDKAFMR